MPQYRIFPLLVLILFACQEAEVVDPPTPDCTINELEQAVIDDLNNNFAYPFNAADPTTPDAQLTPLVDYLSGSKFVGLGEATHGTAEFYQFKDKLFRLLVTEAGFKAIIFEIPWGNALVVNDFVTQGIGTADEVIDQTFYWTYDTQEVRDLAQWLHDYNVDLADEAKIYFVGCDPQGNDFQTERSFLRNYLNQAAPDASLEVLNNYNLLPTGQLNNYPEANTSTHNANIAGTQAVTDYFQENAVQLINNSSELDYEIALMAADVVQQRERLYRTSDFGEGRDALMAIYSEWWQRILGQDQKVAIWAHNRHVWNGGPLNANWMGTYLKQRHGDDYQTVGFSFSRGAFNAFLASANGNFSSGIRRQSIPEAQCHTINHVLEQVEGERHYLIFDELSGSARGYFREAQSFTQLGAGFNLSYIRNYTQEVPLLRLYDVLVHFDETQESVLR